MKLNSNSSAARVKIGFGKAWLCRQIIDSQQIAGGDCDFGCYCDFDCDLDSWRWRDVVTGWNQEQVYW